MIIHSGLIRTLTRPWNKKKCDKKVGKDTVVKRKQFSVIIRSGLIRTLTRSWNAKKCDSKIGKDTVVKRKRLGGYPFRVYN